MHRHPVLPNDLVAALAGDDPAAAALALAALGIPVFPVHAPLPGGCTCGRPCGRDAGKHPRTPRGFLDAAADPRVVRRWWDRWPESNVAVVTGAEAGIWVLDVDPAQGGEAGIVRLEGEHGPVPATWAVETGGGGMHLWFLHPGGPIPCSAGKLAPGLDVRGDGGYAVVPPSRHRSGNRYRWGEAWRPARLPLAPAPPWLLDGVLRAPERKMVPPEVVPLGGGVGGNHPGEASAPIAEGERNATLASLAGSMRRRGFGEVAILAALQEENAARCRPPLSTPEVAAVARSIARYAPDPQAATCLVPAGSDARAVRPGSRPVFVEFVGGKAVAR